MNERLREMIGEDAAELLEKSDSEDLDRMRYSVVCETCNLTVFETSLRGAKIMFKNVKSIGLGMAFVPFHYYLNACKHFIETGLFHQLTVYVVDGCDRTKVKDLSTEWKSQFESQRKMVEEQNRKKGNFTSFEKAMMNEIYYLLKQADKAYGEN